MGLAPASRVRYVGPDGKTIGVANGASGSTPFTVGALTTGAAAKVAGTAAAGASLGAGIGAPAPKAAEKKAVAKTEQDRRGCHDEGRHGQDRHQEQHEEQEHHEEQEQGQEQDRYARHDHEVTR